MKIAISADGTNIGEDKIVTFCGCNYFLIINTEANTLIAIENKNRGLPSKVGNTAGKLVSNEDVNAVIVSEIGPQALTTLNRHKIKVYQKKGTINDAIQELEKKGSLTEITKKTLKNKK
jgi:predicted Fe-Mo cluster-binding NifX family protein